MSDANPMDIHKDRVFQEPYTLYVGNLPPHTIQGDLDVIFSELKKDIKSIRVIKDKLTDVFRGFCYVEFATEAALRTALTFDGAEFMNYVLKIDYADPKRKEQRNVMSRNSNGGGSGSGSVSGNSYNRNNNNDPVAYYKTSYHGRPKNNKQLSNYHDNSQRRGGPVGGSNYYNSQGSREVPPSGYSNNHAGGYNNYNQGGGYMSNDQYQSQGGTRGGFNNHHPNQGGNSYHQVGGNYNNRGGQNRGYNNNNRYQRPLTNARTQRPPLDPLPNSEGRPKLELKKRTVGAPTAELAAPEIRAKIFADALPKEFNKKVTCEDNQDNNEQQNSQDSQPPNLPESATKNEQPQREENQQQPE